MLLLKGNQTSSALNLQDYPMQSYPVATPIEINEVYFCKSVWVIFLKQNQSYQGETKQKVGG